MAFVGAITLLATLMLFGAVLWLLMRLKRPSYRIDAGNILRLLAEIEAGRARHKDWVVFTAMPLRYDPKLEAIRLRCIDIEEAHLLGDSSAHLFDTEGRRKLADIAAELRACEAAR
ncbi:hypothetical protein L1F30_14150 [Simiduia sp. 21SJ11W-1]|uniref:hypothetical protein n=1 Tax=Simiduia sp. 21SJ11W-1 TaxID=2909669 RepID=UPI0020A1CDF1|nr:hypothetical protein [Simiduia sp. 21SJ11W-1]UTA47300.1 hypothetical protein L1F30_14150 [Simiduia sp. 21SJ11W-1]